MKLKKKWNFLIFIITFFGSLIWLIHYNYIKKIKIKIGESVPAFTYYDWNNNIKTFVAKDKKLVLSFISFNCKACLKRFGQIKSLIKFFRAKELKTNFLVFVPVSERSHIVKYFKTSYLKDNIFFIGKNVFCDKLHEQKVPLIYFVDENQKLKYRKTGYVSLLKLRERLNRFSNGIPISASKIMILNKIGAKSVRSKKNYIQQDSKSCGLISLRIIFDSFNIGTKNLKSFQKLANNGLSMLQLKQISRENGLNPQGWILTFKDLINAVSPPLITLILDEHYVVITKIGHDTITVRDPEFGKLKYSHDAFRKIWNNKVLVFHKLKDSFFVRKNHKQF